MAKNITICILFLICLAQGIYIALNRSDTRETIDTAQAKREVRAAQAQRDSLQFLLKELETDLELAQIVASNAMIDANKAHYETQNWRKQYESIRFKPYTDRQRDSVWTALYPAGDSIR